MARIIYDANGNPILDPSQTTTANNKLPPEAPGGLGQQGNQQGQQSNQATPQQTPQNIAGNTGTPTGAAGTGTMQRILQLFGQTPQASAASPAPTQQAALAQGTQVGPPNPSQDQNTNPMVSGAIGGNTGPTQSQQNTSSAIGAIGSGLGQLGQQVASSVPSWKMIPSAIPDPSQFRTQEQQYQYDFQRHQIV